MNTPILPLSHIYPTVYSLPNFDALMLLLEQNDTEGFINLIRAQLSALENIADDLANIATPTWDSFIHPLSEKAEAVSRIWGLVSHLHSTMDSEAIRTLYNSLLPAITTLLTKLSQDPRLYVQTKKLVDSTAFSQCSSTQQYHLQERIKDFVRLGAALSDDSRAEFLAIEERLSALSAKFSENLLDATNAFSYTTNEEKDLKGLPAEVLMSAIARGKEKGVGYALTLQAPDYLAVMEYSTSRTLRKYFYDAFITRASDCIVEDGNVKANSHHALDNSPLIQEILMLRAKKASILGYADYSALSLDSKMAKNYDQVEAFLIELSNRAKPIAKRDMAELSDYAKKQGVADMMPWDIPYFARLQREERYGYTDEEVKRYFPEPTVMKGLFNLAHKLFGIDFHEETVSVWHPSVRFFRLVDKKGVTRGGFYADLFSRDSKKGGAWMDECIGRGQYWGTFHYPVAYLVANFSAPTGSQPSLLTHDDVITLLHELGHVLHHILSDINDLPISGIRGVEWDAVELPSQFMENFAWHYPSLSALSCHIDTGENLPEPLFHKMHAAKNFHSALATLRQVEFALFDLRIHAKPYRDHDVLTVLSEVRREVAVIQPPAYHRFPHSFSHIFAGGYSAGYYSYKWAEVLSCDGFSMVEEQSGEGALQAIGEKFRAEVLSMGGGRSAIESFKAFRGREPDIRPLLVMSGLA